MSLYLGCAGWSLPRSDWPRFPAQGTHLQRYAAVLSAVEINSSFYRPHPFSTYQRWAASVPDAFRFSVKLPKRITHELRLRECATALDEFLGQCHGLEQKLGCLLVQLPPSFAYDEALTARFFKQLRERFSGSVALEPRHQSWHAAHALLREQRIAQVAADPSPFNAGTLPGGWPGLRYYRLHGAPRLYYSAYDDHYLSALAASLGDTCSPGLEAWCLFDNTASGAATANVLALQAMLT